MAGGCLDHLSLLDKVQRCLAEERGVQLARVWDAGRRRVDYGDCGQYDLSSAEAGETLFFRVWRWNSTCLLGQVAIKFLRRF